MERQLFDACGTGDFDQVIELNDPQIDINWQNDYFRTPLYIACEKGQTGVVKLLLNDKRIHINQADGSGKTHFYIACEYGHLEIVKLLSKDERVEVSKPNIFGQTPFYIACEKGHTGIVKLLLNDERIDVNTAGDASLMSPFWIACYGERIEVVKLLLNDERVDINKGNTFGHTPFHALCFFGYVEIMEYIIASGREIKNLNAIDNDGKTPIGLAREREIEEIDENWESEEKFQKRKRDCTKVVELLESFERNPIEMRFNLKIKHG